MFLNALMLAGLGGAVLPVVLHLLSRARYRRVEWGAMMFLQQAESEQLHSSRLKQFLLLLLRMLIIALLAVALARPLASGGFATLAQGQRIAAVLVIDVSPSMAYPERDRTRLDLAKDAALAVLARLRRGDSAALVLLGANVATPNDRFTTDLQDLAARVARLENLAGPSNVADGVREAYELLDGVSGASGEIYVITDKQASSWQDFKAFRAPVKSVARVFSIPVGGDETQNIAIESVELLGPPAVRELPGDVEVRVRNYGDQPRGEVPLILRADDREIGRSTLFLPANGSTTARQRVRFREAGSTVLTAQIEAGGLTQDDKLDRAIDVVEPVSVTVITSDARTRVGPADFSGETDYFRLAVAPFGFTNGKGVDPAAIRVVNETQWPDLTRKDRVVVLADVGKLDARQARALEQFVLAGGGLLIAPGARLDVTQTNELLYRAGAGLLPAPVTGVMTSDTGAERLIGVETTHPVFRFLQGRADPVPGIAASRYVRFGPLPAAATVLATMRSGDPLLFVRPFGRGRVAVLAVPLDADWSNLPLSNLYLPLMQSLVKFLAEGGTADRNLMPGATIEASYDNPADNFAFVQRPDGQTARVEIARAGGAGTVLYTDTDLPGRYVVRSREQRPRDYVVARPLSESDLTQITPADYADLERAANFKSIAPDASAIARVVGQSRAGTELSLWFLAGAACVAGIESIAAQRWGGGVR